MTKEIDVDTLRTWLDEGRAVTVVDVRNDEARAQWAIPGSVHVNAYDALRSGHAGLLADVQLPRDQAVIAVCNAGRVSQTAAALLTGLGVDAYSLAGGMKAWSLAWNTANVPLADASTRVIQVRRTGKGCLSYIIGSGTDALVLDPALAPDVYLTMASRHGWRVRAVLETHIHADHLSRARVLAERAHAELLLPEQGRVHFPFTVVRDGDRIAVGDAVIEARRTPGHTQESTSYVLNDQALFTGDTLFTRGVGRPDLHASETEARTRARMLFHSLRRLSEWPPEMLVLPAHASEPLPFDGRPLAATMRDIGGWLSERISSEDVFVDRVTSRLPDTPPNFARIVDLNERGELPDGDLTELEAGANRCAVA